PLRELLDASLSTAPPASAVLRLHLRAKLFGFPPDAAARLRARPDLPALLPGLVVFWSEPRVDELLAGHARVADFVAAYATLEGPALHRLAVGWATGAEARPPPAVAALAGIAWWSVVDDLRSR